MTFTKGKELYAPIRFNNFEVGPYTVTLQPLMFGSPPAALTESFEDMSKRAHAVLDDVFNQEFERQLNNHLDRLERMGEIVKQRRS